MIIECRNCGTKNRIPDSPTTAGRYRCAHCKQSIHGPQTVAARENHAEKEPSTSAGPRPKSPTWTETNIVRFLVGLTTTHAAFPENLVIVRYEALIAAMYVIFSVLLKRFGDRVESVLRGYASAMVPHLVEAGLAEEQVEDHVKRRFARYDQIHSQWSRGAAMGPGRQMASNITGRKLEEVPFDDYIQWEAWHVAFIEAVTLTIDREGIVL